MNNPPASAGGIKTKLVKHALKGQVIFEQKLNQLSATSSRRIDRVFLLALTLFYLSLSPGTVEGMGYLRENLVTAGQLSSNLVDLLTLQPVSSINWTRHGAVEPVLELPFALISRLFFGSSVKWLGGVMTLQPILATSLLCTLILVWTRKITKSPVWAYLLALIAGVTTMIWPYAYIGLETSQSLFLLLSGYLALERSPTYRWSEIALLALTCAITISVKQNGVFLTPAIAFLLFYYFGEQRARGVGAAHINLKRVLAVVVIGVIFYLNLQARNSAWAATAEGDVGYAITLLVNDPLLSLLQAFSYFGSPNKSLLIYAPVTALGLIALPQAYRRRPEIVIFAFLALGGLVGGFSLVYMWADETWGPRYLHASIALLTISFAATRSGNRLRLRSEIPLLGTAVLGAAISFLGTFFYYGNLHNVATRTSEATLSGLQQDLRLNHIRFNFELLKIWGRKSFGMSERPQLWPESHHWWFERPGDVTSEKKIDLNELATPQPLLLTGWSDSLPISPHSYRYLRLMLVGSFGLSLALFGGLAYLVRQSQSPPLTTDLYG